MCLLLEARLRRENDCSVEWSFNTDGRILQVKAKDEAEELSKDDTSFESSEGTGTPRSGSTTPGAQLGGGTAGGINKQPPKKTRGCPQPQLSQYREQQVQHAQVGVWPPNGVTMK